MLFTNEDCPRCGYSITSYDLWEGDHLTGCGEQIPNEIYDDLESVP